MPAIAPILTAMRRMISRATLESTDDSGMGQRLKVRSLDDEVVDKTEHWQPYGLTYHPPSGGEALLVSVGGDRAHPVVIAVADRRYRVSSLASGEVCLHDDQGQKVVLYRDRVEIEAPTVVVKSDDVHLGDTGGPRVARIGDRVNVSAGSSAGLWPIVEGSDKVSCA